MRLPLHTSCRVSGCVVFTTHLNFLLWLGERCTILAAIFAPKHHLPPPLAQVFSHISNSLPPQWSRLVTFLPPTAVPVETNNARQLLAALTGTGTALGDTTRDGVLDGESP